METLDPRLIQEHEIWKNKKTTEALKPKLIQEFDKQGYVKLNEEQISRLTFDTNSVCLNYCTISSNIIKHFEFRFQQDFHIEVIKKKSLFSSGEYSYTPISDTYAYNTDLKVYFLYKKINSVERNFDKNDALNYLLNGEK
jgi:hypothetical protein